MAKKHILDELKNLRDSDLYPLHMPGHKRNKNAGPMAGYMDIDITEIDDYDNLHDAEGMILDAEKRAAKLYGAEETHFLVNGSTCGVLSAVSAAVSKGGKLITARNCHKSLYNAAYLRELGLAYIIPESTKISGPVAKGEWERGSGLGDSCYEKGTRLLGRISPDSVREALLQNEDTQAVFITSPTYEGISSDIKAIADICHEKGVILIVDSAHGAHFGLDDRLPKSAVCEGADIVICSVHKTLASMTQTALIHVQGNLVNRERLRRYLRIYQSSSPSYVLMASVDSCLKDIEERGQEVFSRLINFRKKIEEETAECRNIFIPGLDEISDPGKVLICSASANITGQQIYDILRLEYHMQLEMAGDAYGLAIITGYDTDEGIDRLIQAIKDIDSRISAKDTSGESKTFNIPRTVFPLYKAWDADPEYIDIAQAAGRIAGDFINLYPPGIPLIVPGEVFDKDLLSEIGQFINDGMNLQGVEITARGERLLKVIKSEI
ncbi:aminotransferase class I/II-fold pyridoxal phosphate-dependent enzyme [Butyrivibrio sp. WCD3002]|uniref:aminotransferase class I/II-fold pyridoxal phosphate-dependent enzyme n=1 Tax=Butyrivibrio sp. WCD3002 TaxID=1280676 RepID=UPI00041FEEF0|nr:DegT/DnrJ/EryC1/StrS family aminotransferase [Butyrivibrio sp. WCD3002]